VRTRQHRRGVRNGKIGDTGSGAEGAFTKLMRTFAAQMEARAAGEQKVTAQHGTVSDGGQTIVGNVTQGSREAPPNKSLASQPLLADAETAPMPITSESKRAPVRAGKKSEECSSAQYRADAFESALWRENPLR
jgi:hypothetical protein